MLKLHQFKVFLLLYLLLNNKVMLKLLNRILIELYADLLRGFLNSSRWQIQLSEDGFSAHYYPICLRKNYRFRYLLSVGLISSSVFDFDVQVKRAFRTIEFLALLIRTLIPALDIIGASSVMLFAP